MEHRTVEENMITAAAVNKRETNYPDAHSQPKDQILQDTDDL